MLPADPSDIDLEIEEFVVDALERLPQPFASQLGSVAIVIEDEPSPAQLASVGAHGLFGLYQGIPRTRLSADAAPDAEQDHPVPRPARPRRHAIARRSPTAVADTVYHEIAHHFGISDARLHELKGGAPLGVVGSAPAGRRAGRWRHVPASPSRWAIAPASVRFAAPSLSKMCEAWTLAVLRLMNRASAICWLVQPAGDEAQDLDLALGEADRVGGRRTGVGCGFPVTIGGKIEAG